MNKPFTVVMIEDDKSIRSMVNITLTAQGYKVVETESGVMGLNLIKSHYPDVIILDLGLPDMDGIEVIRKIRAEILTPVIIISARGHDQDKIDALDAGADDYLTKPFSVPELLARIRVALRHKQVAEDALIKSNHLYRTGELQIDFEKHKVTLKNEEVHLTPIEFKLLELLARNSGKVLTHRFIINEVWGGYTESDHLSLRVFMASIRRKIEDNSAKPRYLMTEVGVGYRLNEE